MNRSEHPSIQPPVADYTRIESMVILEFLSVDYQLQYFMLKLLHLLLLKDISFVLTAIQRNYTKTTESRSGQSGSPRQLATATKMKTAIELTLLQYGPEAYPWDSRLHLTSVLS